MSIIGGGGGGTKFSFSRSSFIKQFSMLIQNEIFVSGFIKWIQVINILND